MERCNGLSVEVIGWYAQRLSMEKDTEAKAIMLNALNEDAAGRAAGLIPLAARWH